jgi:hypothetical protein
MKNKYPNLETEINEKEPQYWADKMSNIEVWLLEAYKKQVEKEKYNFSKKKTKGLPERKDLNIFEFAPKEILENQDVMLKAVDSSFINYFNLPETLKKSREFTLRYLKEGRGYHFCIEKEFLIEDEIFNFCLKKDARTYTEIYYKRDFYEKFGSKEKALEFLDMNPKVYEFLGDILKNDTDIAKKAIELDLENVQHVSKRTSAKVLKNDELVKKVLDKNLDWFIKINNKYRDNEEFLLPYIEKRPSLIEFISPRLREKKEFIEKAVGAYNLMEYISEEFKRDKELMLRHLSHQPYARYELSKLFDVVPLVVKVIQKQQYMYDRLSDNEKVNPDYIYALLEHQDFYKKNDNFFSSYEKANIFQKLPEVIQNEVKNEYLEKNKHLNLNFSSQEDLEIELLMYARNKYVNLYLEKSLRQEPNKPIKNKLKV